MATNKYRVLQMTNSAIGAVAVNSFMPLGKITRKVSRCECSPNTFAVSTTGANVVTINECGNYNVNYNASLIAGAAGVLAITLVMNGTNVYSSTVTATAGGTVNISLPYQIRVFPNCSALPTNIPSDIQILLSGVAITGGTSNLIVERVY